MNNTLYVSDLDGTLLNRNSQISTYSVTTINQFIEEGMIFTYATARSLYSALPVTKGLTIKYPVIIYNGCAIVNAKTKEVLYQQSFTSKQVVDIKEKMLKHSLHPFVYAFIDGNEKVTFNNKYVNEGMRYYLSNRKEDPRFIATNSDDVYQGDVFYFTCIGDKEELEPMYQEIKDNDTYHVVFHQEIYREEYWLEIMPAKASKANAILELKRILKVDKVVSFGDAINDILMFSISDTSLAVENAVSQLKQVASEVIASNEEDGVAKWLKNHVKT